MRRAHQLRAASSILAVFLTHPAALNAAPEGATAAASASSASSDAEDEPGKQPIRWHGTTLMLDQSATTQTVGVGADYQSANPTYEWWLAFKPRYFLLESRASSLSVHAWANLYLELTNSDTTTRQQEVVIGPTYAWASYNRTLRDRNGYRTTLALGPRATLPTDKAARNSGQIIGAGALIGVSQDFPGMGRSARAFRDARLGVTAIYNHPITVATSGVDDDLRWTRQDVGGRAILSDQLTGGMMVAHALNLALSGEVQLLPRVNLSLSYVLLNSWVYRPPRSDCEMTDCVRPIEVANPTTARVSTWVTASVAYQVIKDLSVTFGYYNLASQLGLDGTYRNPLWSPSARFFLSLTGTLDVTYARFIRRRQPGRT